MILSISPIIAIVFPFFILLILEYAFGFCSYIFSDFLASIYEISAKTIVKQAKNKAIHCLILDKSFLENQKINNLKKEKYFYTIKSKKEFSKYQNNNLIFENL